MPRKNNKKNWILGLGALAAVGLIVYLVAFSPFAPVSQTPTSGNSTFQLFSYIDGEDVSEFVEISIWIPDNDADFDETEDIYTWSNFEEEESSKDADDISIDLSSYDYVWVEVDPDAEQVFANNHYLITPGGRNSAFKYYVYHQSSDVNFFAFDNTTAAMWYNFTLPVAAGTAASMASTLHALAEKPYGFDQVWNATILNAGTFGTYAIQENATIILDVPEYTHANTHVGSNWNIEQSEYDDMSVREKEEVHDEHNWRSQAPVYVPADDLEKNGEDGLYSVTNAFCLRWTYNTTVSTTDAAATQVNMTVSDNTPAEVVIDGTYIYMIFYDVIEFENGVYTVDFEYEEAHQIYATAFQSGRIVVPRGSQSLGTFTAYSNVGQ